MILSYLLTCRYFQTKSCVAPKSILEYPVYSLYWTHSFINLLIDNVGPLSEPPSAPWLLKSQAHICDYYQLRKGSVCINRKLCDRLRMTARSQGEGKKQNKYWQILMPVSPSLCDLWARQRSPLRLVLFSYEMGHYLSRHITLLTVH